MMLPFDRDAATEAMVRAMPYVRLFRDTTFVVKAGGRVCHEELSRKRLIEQLSVLRELGIRIVVVHGGGPQTTSLCERLGVRTELVGGRRITPSEVLDASIMTLNGTVRTALLSSFRAAEVPAVGLSGVDAGLITARRRPPVDIEGRHVDFGLVGDLVSVNPTAIHALLDAGMLPVVSPLCASEDGTVLNVNADTVAAGLAGAVKASKLIFLTDTPGLMERPDDPSSLVSYTDLRGIDAMVERGAIGTGMLPKVRAAKDALATGVKRVHMVGERVHHGLLREVLTNEGAGTLVVKDMAELSPSEAQPPDAS